jgi:hypothetical protein
MPNRASNYGVLIRHTYSSGHMVGEAVEAYRNMKHWCAMLIKTLELQHA